MTGRTITLLEAIARALVEAAARGREAAGPCVECGGSGYAVHPENGRNRGARRCGRGCPVRCSVCADPDCDNPGGQH